MTECDTEVRIGTSVTAVFKSDHPQREQASVQSIGATGITGIVESDLVTPYRFFQFLDPVGNRVEVGRYGP